MGLLRTDFVCVINLVFYFLHFVLLVFIYIYIYLVKCRLRVSCHPTLMCFACVLLIFYLFERVVVEAGGGGGGGWGGQAGKIYMCIAFLV